MDFLELLQKAVPEIIEIFEKRYNILKAVYTHQPVGRRTLAGLLGMGESMIRSETGLLRDGGLITITSAGITVTPEGEDVLDGLQQFNSSLKGLHLLEKQAAELLGIERVVAVPGNIDEDASIMSMIGKAAAGILSRAITDGSIIAVTGGSSVYSAAQALKKGSAVSGIMVLPARGGIGREVEYQSNTIASILAKKLGGSYRLLHLPDQLTTEAAETLLNDPETHLVIEGVKKSDILICGIGRAHDMASRRNMADEQLSALINAGAVAEAFGYYFNRRGEIILASNPIGLHISDLKRIPKVIAIAGGRLKAEAIAAVLTGWTNSTLITDEAAVHEIMRSAAGKGCRAD